LKDGWWAGATEVQAQGQRALIKKYDGDKDRAYKVNGLVSVFNGYSTYFQDWLRDVKVLQNL